MIEKPGVAQELDTLYLKADFGKEYVGYFEIPQEDAKDLALYIYDLEKKIEELENAFKTQYDSCR